MITIPLRKSWQWGKNRPQQTEIPIVPTSSAASETLVKRYVYLVSNGVVWDKLPLNVAQLLLYTDRILVLHHQLAMPTNRKMEMKNIVNVGLEKKYLE